MEANSVDLYEPSDLDLHCLVEEASNISADQKSIQLFCGLHFKA